MGRPQRIQNLRGSNPSSGLTDSKVYVVLSGIFFRVETKSTSRCFAVRKAAVTTEPIARLEHTATGETPVPGVSLFRRRRRSSFHLCPCPQLVQNFSYRYGFLRRRRRSASCSTSLRETITLCNPQCMRVTDLRHFFRAKQYNSLGEELPVKMTKFCIRIV